MGDLTEPPTGEGRFHLAAILDLYSRRCVGFAMGEPEHIARPSIAICVLERSRVAGIERRLARAGIPAAAIGPDGPKLDDVVRIGTMHRFKGLEYQHMILAGVCDGLVPRAYIQRYRSGDPQRHRRETQRACSLLFVAATRARDSLMISWRGDPSSFLPGQR